MTIKTETIAVPIKKIKPLPVDRETEFKKEIALEIDRQMSFELTKALVDPYDLLKFNCHYLGHDFVFGAADKRCNRCREFRDQDTKFFIGKL